MNFFFDIFKSARNGPNKFIQHLLYTSIMRLCFPRYVDISGNPFVTWATDAASQTNPPAVNSISWGMVEQVEY